MNKTFFTTEYENDDCTLSAVWVVASVFALVLCLRFTHKADGNVECGYIALWIQKNLTDSHHQSIIEGKNAFKDVSLNYSHEI